MLICSPPVSWTESYGGRYGPAFVNFFEDQNAKIANKSINRADESYELHIRTLGIINGCIDPMAQEHSYITMVSLLSFVGGTQR